MLLDDDNLILHDHIEDGANEGMEGVVFSCTISNY